MELTHKEVTNILGIIDGAEHLDEVELVFAGFRLHVRRGSSPEGGTRPVHAPPPISTASRTTPAPLLPAATAAPVGAALSDGEVAIRAPMLGTFYRSPSPGERPFVEVGQAVSASDNVCVIEVMKLFNTIRAGVDGTVVRIAVENGALVEYNQIMIVIASKV